MMGELKQILANFFHIGDSYHYILGRDKEAFSLGTMSLDDFKEYDDDDVAEIAEYLIDNGVIVETGRWATGDEMRCYPRVPYKTFKHYCTACEHEALRVHDEEILTECCPFCGAKMDM